MASKNADHPTQDAFRFTPPDLGSVSPDMVQAAKEGTYFGTLKRPGKDVFVKSHNSDWKPAVDGMVILPGDEVKTSTTASVGMLLEEGRVGHIEIKEGSLFRIHKAEIDPKTGDKTTLLDLASGEVLVHAEKLQGGSRFEVRTPTAIFGVRGTVFEVNVKEKA